MASHQQELDCVVTEPHGHTEESLVILSCFQIKAIITLHHLQESVIFFPPNATFLCQQLHSKFIMS